LPLRHEPDDRPDALRVGKRRRLQEARWIVAIPRAIDPLSGAGVADEKLQVVRETLLQRQLERAVEEPAVGAVTHLEDLVESRVAISKEAPVFINPVGVDRNDPVLVETETMYPEYRKSSRAMCRPRSASAIAAAVGLVCHVSRTGAGSPGDNRETEASVYF
jgi:hypothetical protein